MSSSRTAARHARDVRAASPGAMPVVSPAASLAGLARTGLVLACLALGACGFTLRGTQQLPYPTIALNVPPNSLLGVELARNIRTGTHTRVVADPTQAAATFDLLAEVRGEHVNPIVNAQGRTTDYTLRYRLRFRLRDAQGREVIENTELQVQRDLSFNDSQRLSKESEEALLIRDMESDLVQQLLRRLAAAKPYATAD